MTILNELAFDKSKIADKCYDLGQQFVSHFDKIYKEDNNETKKHHAAEMQNWYDQVKDLRFKGTNKKINVKQLFDWFFMPNVVVAVDLFNNDDEAYSYIEFSDLVLDEDYSIYDALEELGLIGV